MFGFLNIDKPAGMTSRDVVNRIQRLVRPCKVGHAGTLDPLATGVLVVCLGHATRLVDYVHRYAKRYDAVFLLGRESDTEDVEGQVTELLDAPTIDQGQLDAVLPRFVGRISQIPPAHSALKVDGQRAYSRARRGESVVMEARPVTIHTVHGWISTPAVMRLDITCGTGTYVRSLGRDIARAMGTGAVMSELRRLAIGPFAVEQAVALPVLEQEGLAGIARRLLPPRDALAGLETRTLTEWEERRVRQGQTLGPDPAPLAADAAIITSPAPHGQLDFPPTPDESIVAAYGADGRLAALLRKLSTDRWQPSLVFPRETAN